MDLARQRIHILGVGSIGRLFAHSLAKTAPPDAPPIVLLRQNPSPEVSYSESIILTRGNEKDEQAGFENEHVNDVLDPELPIRNLIVATKAAYTVKAIRSIRRRLDSQSTILFAQNGMGITDEVYNALFRKMPTPPIFLSSIITHGVYTTGPNSIEHAGIGNVHIAATIHNKHLEPKTLNPNRPAAYLLGRILEATPLNAKHIPSRSLEKEQLKKLAVNAVINPLTALLKIRNGELLGQDYKDLVDVIVEETSAVLTAHATQQYLDPQEFTAEALHAAVHSVATATAQNYSSMLRDMQRGAMTEVDYINGWIVRAGEKLGKSVVLNRGLARLVEEKSMEQFNRFGKVPGKERRMTAEEVIGTIRSMGSPEYRPRSRI